MLGTILLEGVAALPRVREALTPAQFYTDAHRLTYEAMLRLDDRGAGVSLLTLSAELRRADHLALVGGPAALALMVEQASVEVLLPQYVAIVREMATLRDTIHVCLETMTAAYEAKTPADDLVTRHRDAVDALVAGAAPVHLTAGPQTIKVVLTQLVATIGTPEEDFLPCPFPGFNEHLGGGLLRSQYVVLGGRPATAKSAMVAQWAVHVARAGGKVLLVSAEMEARAVVRRMLAQESGIDATTLRTRKLQGYDWPRIVRACDRLYDLPLSIDDTTDTLAGIERRVKAGGYRLVIVDYAQLIRSTAHTHEGPRIEVSAVSRGLKLLSRSANTTVIALSALTRLTVDRGKVQRPDESKLKESGALEADGDVVLILHWPDVTQSEREMIFAKVREGASGGVPMTLDFHPSTVRFVVPDQEAPSDVPF